MRKRTMMLGLVGGLALALPAAVALAGPWGNAKKKTGKTGDSDSVEVTVVAGKGRLGVSILEISPELRVHFGAPRDRGVLVNTIRAGSPAARAGIAVGDVVTEVDGDAVEDASQVLSAMSDRKKGETVNIALVRGGKPMTLKATMEDDPGAASVAPDTWRQFKRGFDFGTPGEPGFGRDIEKRIQELERRLQKLETNP
jgi:membrane-associated protease RseP (regulator of RpoE activity)